MSTKFQRRTKCPTSGNKYYMNPDYGYGGWSNCIYSNKQAFKGATIYNCVGYAWGRWAEAQCTNGKCENGKTAKQLIAMRPKGNACTIYENCKKNGSGFLVNKVRPKVGSIVCWTGGASGKYAGYGHVAIVEKVNADGTIDISDCYSSYSSKRGGYFAYTKNVNPKTYLSGYTFQGYVYPLVEFV